MRTSPGTAGSKEFCPSSVRFWLKSHKDSIAVLRFCKFCKKVYQSAHAQVFFFRTYKKKKFSSISDDIDGVQAVVKRLNPEKENVEVQQPIP